MFSCLIPCTYAETTTAPSDRARAYGAPVNPRADEAFCHPWPLRASASVIGCCEVAKGSSKVDDCDASTKKANALGGKMLVEPTDVPEIGRFAIVQDPTGAAIALFESLRRGSSDRGGDHRGRGREGCTSIRRPSESHAHATARPSPGTRRTQSSFPGRSRGRPALLDRREASAEAERMNEDSR